MVVDHDGKTQATTTGFGDKAWLHFVDTKAIWIEIFQAHMSPQEGACTLAVMCFVVSICAN